MSRGRDQKLIPENPWKLLKTLDFMVMRDLVAGGFGMVRADSPGEFGGLRLGLRLGGEGLRKIICFYNVLRDKPCRLPDRPNGKRQRLLGREKYGAAGHAGWEQAFLRD